MASAAYESGSPGAGWSKDNSYLGTLDRAGSQVLSDASKSGLQFEIFKATDGRTVLSFRGTEPIRGDGDWKTNIQQYLNGPRSAAQYVAAANIASYLARNNIINNETVLTGHSLGGGIAQFVTQLANEGKLGKNQTPFNFRAVTFNAAGLSNDLIKNIVMIKSDVANSTTAAIIPTTTILQSYKNGMNGNVANINSSDDVVSRLPGASQIGQEFIVQGGGWHLMGDLIEKISKSVGGNTSVSNAVATITSSVSAIGPIAFQTANTTPQTVKTTAQPLSLNSGSNTYSEGNWTVTTGLQSGLRQGVSGSQLGLATGNDGYTVISNEGAPFIYAQKTFKAGSGNNGSFNFNALAAFITTEHQRCAPCNVFGLDRGLITFISSTGQQVTKSLQQIYGVNAQGRVVFSNNPGNGTLTTPLRQVVQSMNCLLYTSPSPRDRTRSRMPSSA